MNDDKPDPTDGKCECKDIKIDPAPPDENQPFRRFVAFFEDHLDTLPQDPPEPIKKFRDDLKEAEKEYQGIAAIVTKYKLFYDKLDCKLAEVRSQKEQIDGWLKEFDQGTAGAIKDLWSKNYEKKEHDLCCAWIEARDQIIQNLDCVEQAKRKEQDAKDDYDGAKDGGAIKDWEKTLTAKFADLTSLYDKAKTFNGEQRYNAVYAVSLEYAAVYDNLTTFRDWGYARRKCREDVAGGDIKKDWTPENLKKALATRLRALVLARYQRFRRLHDSLSLAAEAAEKKAACEAIRANRRGQFIEEAEDVQSPKPPTRDQQTPTQQPQAYQGRQESSSA
jgi:hypothetical protein